MKNVKKAFTLGELIFVFIIIGIIASIGIVTVRPWEKAFKYAYIKIYNALSVAIYNYTATVSGSDAFPETPALFCNALISYINTSNNAQNAQNPCNLSGGKDDFLGNNPSLDDFNGGKNPKIKASNGAWLWIGADNGKPFTYTQTLNSDSETDVVKYYIVYVDLNGDKKPNAIAYGRKLPDIVAFAVTDSSVVVPFGYPKVDQRYLSAHIIYPLTEDEDEVYTKLGGHPSDSMTYYEALVGAYGKAPNKIITSGAPETYDIENSLPDTSPFKLVGGDLDAKYVNPPVFDSEMCGDGKTAAQIIADKNDSHCEIKVFNYN